MIHKWFLHLFFFCYSCPLSQLSMIIIRSSLFSFVDNNQLIIISSGNIPVELVYVSSFWFYLIYGYSYIWNDKIWSLHESDNALDVFQHSSWTCEWCQCIVQNLSVLCHPLSIRILRSQFAVCECGFTMKHCCVAL